MEKFIKRKEIFNGRVIKVVEDDVLVDDKINAKREVVYHRGGACIALHDLSDDKFFLVRQYRYALESEMYEFCAGKLEEGEEPLYAVQRESEEELGFKAENIKSFGYMVPTCGYSSEKIHLFYGEKGEEVGMHLDVDESLAPVKFSLEEIESMIASGIINDGKTICLVYHVKKYLGK